MFWRESLKIPHSLKKLLTFRISPIKQKMKSRHVGQNRPNPQRKLFLHSLSTQSSKKMCSWLIFFDHVQCPEFKISQKPLIFEKKVSCCKSSGTARRGVGQRASQRPTFVGKHIRFLPSVTNCVWTRQEAHVIHLGRAAPVPSLGQCKATTPVNTGGGQWLQHADHFELVQHLISFFFSGGPVLALAKSPRGPEEFEGWEKKIALTGLASKFARDAAAELSGAVRGWVSGWCGWWMVMVGGWVWGNDHSWKW